MKIMDEIKYNQFCELISTFVRLKPKKEVVSREDLLTQFSNLTNDLGILKGRVYSKRYKETKSIIEANRHKIQFSTFELMEHNFRENTHSRVLRYLFHHKFIEKGSKILSKFISEISPEISELVEKNQYEIINEHRVFSGKGRIDLFIKDTKNKFVIVIENKIYADVNIEEISSEGEVTKTQLTRYEKYVEETYKDYKHCFVLLSFKEVEESLDVGKFRTENYDRLIQILNNVESDDNILKEYKNLLYSITKMEYNREHLIDLIADIKGEGIKEVSLSNLEIINTYYE